MKRPLIKPPKKVARAIVVKPKIFLDRQSRVFLLVQEEERCNHYITIRSEMVQVLKLENGKPPVP